MSEDKKIYELCYLLTSPDAEEEVLALLSQHEGQLLHQGKISEIRLAYPINKQEAALFGFLQFNALPENVVKLSKTLSFNKKILRYIVMNLPLRAVVSKTQEPEAAPSRVEQVIRPAEPRPVKPEALTNEALEEKLEEILK